MSDGWVGGRLIPRSIDGHKKKERENDDNSLFFSMRERPHLSMWLLPDSSTRTWWEHSKFAKIPWYYPCNSLWLEVGGWRWYIRSICFKYQWSGGLASEKLAAMIVIKNFKFFFAMIVVTIFRLSRSRLLGSTCGRSAKAMWQSSSGTSVDNQGGYIVFIPLFVCLFVCLFVWPLWWWSRYRRWR